MDIFMYIEIIDVCMPLKLRKFTCTHTDIDKMYFKMKINTFKMFHTNTVTLVCMSII